MVTKWACPPEVGVAQAFEHPILEILATPLIATTDLEYGALLNDYGEYADNFTVNISSIFFVRI